MYIELSFIVATAHLSVVSYFSHRFRIDFSQLETNRNIQRTCTPLLDQQSEEPFRKQIFPTCDPPFGPTPKFPLPPAQIWHK